MGEGFCPRCGVVHVREKSGILQFDDLKTRDILNLYVVWTG